MLITLQGFTSESWYAHFSAPKIFAVVVRKTRIFAANCEKIFKHAIPTLVVILKDGNKFMKVGVKRIGNRLIIVRVIQTNFSKAMTIHVRTNAVPLKAPRKIFYMKKIFVENAKLQTILVTKMLRMIVK